MVSVRYEKERLTADDMFLVKSHSDYNKLVELDDTRVGIRIEAPCQTKQTNIDLLWSKLHEHFTK